ncbi:MAG TPA: biotin/lipoyl-containing protein [Vicinamibacterales bacterium]|nr:biotin/lipoyl-containing protein [Vicinamibacterales bacterium]
MTFEIEVNGRTRIVSVEKMAAVAGRPRFRVRLDGVAHDIESAATESGLSILYLDSGRSLDVAMTERPGGELAVHLPHVTVEAVVDARRYRRGGGGPVAATGDVRVSAPMPGRIVRVLVKPGDAVEARQGLVVVEAMKMENEIAAARAGVVKEVAVSAGQSVESGRLLVVIE